jgi:hypothetical protein
MVTSHRSLTSSIKGISIKAGLTLDQAGSLYEGKESSSRVLNPPMASAGLKRFLIRRSPISEFRPAFPASIFGRG